MHSASEGMDTVVVGTVSESNGGADNIKGQMSCKNLHFQEVPYVDEDCDTNGDDICQIPGRIPLENNVTGIPTKVELKTLTHMAKRPAVDIEFQDLTYSVRNPGRRRGKMKHSKVVLL